MLNIVIFNAHERLRPCRLIEARGQGIEHLRATCRVSMKFAMQHDEGPNLGWVPGTGTEKNDSMEEPETKQGYTSSVGLFF